MMKKCKTPEDIMKKYGIKSFMPALRALTAIFLSASLPANQAAARCGSDIDSLAALPEDSLCIDTACIDDGMAAEEVGTAKTSGMYRFRPLQLAVPAALIGVGVNVSGASAFTAAVVFLLCVVGAILTFAPIGSMRKLVRQN